MESTTPTIGEPTGAAGWAPTGPLAIDKVASHWTALQAQLADGRAVSWSQAFFVEDKFEFTLVRTR